MLATKTYVYLLLLYFFFRYFRIKNLFGLCCYEKLSLDSTEERGARMKSVGIISYSYTTLFRHIQFLESQVRSVRRCFYAKVLVIFNNFASANYSSLK